MKKAIIFDLDGTLLNTDLLIKKSFIHTFKKYKPGYTLSEEELLSFLGPSLKNTFSRYVEEDQVDELIQYYREYNQAHHEDYVTIYPYVEEMLKYLKAQDFPLAVVTTKYKKAAILGLNLFNITPYFDVIIGENDVKHSKPDPEGILCALKKLNCQEGYYVGDNVTDIQAGKNAGIKTVGVKWSPKGYALIEKEHPDLLINDYQEYKGERKMLDLIIIGAGPAGLSACLYASRAGLDVLIFDSAAPGGKLNVTAQIENYPGLKPTPGPEIAFTMYESALSFGAKMEYGEVLDIKDYGDYKEVITAKQTYQTKYVLIATGTKERQMNLEKENELVGRGISYCAVCDGPFFKNQEVAVIGGGNSALEEAMYLATLCKKVHLIVRRDVFRADKIIQDRLLKSENIEVHFKRKPAEILEEDNKVKGLVLENSETGEKEELMINGIFPFIGLDPMTQCAKSLGIVNAEGYIDANENMETAVKGVFVAGDVRSKQLRQVVTATNDGAIAGQYIASLK